MMNAVPSFKFTLVAALLLASTCAVAQNAPAATETQSACERLAQLQVPNATITLAQTTAAGAFSGPPQVFSGRDLSGFYKSLPAFCRVDVTAKPTSDSDIKIALWMPLSGWNGKFQGLGNGGFAGLIDYQQIGAAMKLGYAAAATDTGHAGSPIDATWAAGHPEKVIDFGHRGVHEMTRVSKAVIQAFYGNGPRHSYFAGCSDGGREALMEAQRYPEDYDGILAGAPANNWVPLLASGVWNTQALTLKPESFIPQSKIPMIGAAVVAACDSLDGVRDGILNDPRKCRFDPATIECKASGDTEHCLTAPQVVALKKLYAGTPDSKGHIIFPGYLPGAETGPGGWGLWITGQAPARGLMALFGTGFFSYFVYEKPNWDYKTFSLATDVKAAEQKTAAALNATDPNLKPFASRGGRLILYHGWNDPAISAKNTVEYFNAVETKMGRAADSFMRLYMAPGVQHCGGGPGPDTFGQGFGATATDPGHNMRLALEQWVEGGQAPSTIIASKFPNDDEAHASMTRPLCPYPQTAKYKGRGDTNDAANFSCEKPR